MRAVSRQSRVREEILAGVEMIDEAEACRLLDLEDEGRGRFREDYGTRVISFEIDGQSRFPLFQFDSVSGTIFSAIVELRLDAIEAGWSDLRLLNWLLRPHLDLPDTPVNCLGRDGAAVAEAFRRGAQPPMHG